MGAMQLGDVTNTTALPYGKPLEGVRVLAAEQMQALPFATQLLARLGADVVKVEHPTAGESGRAALPAMHDPEGRSVGATFLRNNLGKRSVGLDLKSDEGRELFLRLVPRFDVVAENFKPGTMERLGLGYDVVSGVHPGVIYASISGFGNPIGDFERSPYESWPAYAAVAESMSGMYEYYRKPGQPPAVNPAGALGDISSAMFGVIGILAALQHRQRTGQGQVVDVAMMDAMIAMTDVVTNFWSLGVRGNTRVGGIIDGFQAADGWFTMQVVRDHQFAKLAAMVGREDWLTDERLADRASWAMHVDDLLRADIEAWAADKTKLEACETLCDAGIAAGPCFSALDVIGDPHVANRHMLVEMPRPDGVDEPILIPGNPVKLSKMAEGPETRVPWVGEHTDEVLQAELGLGDGELDDLRKAGTIS